MEQNNKKKLSIKNKFVIMMNNSQHTNFFLLIYLEKSEDEVFVELKDK